MRLGATDLGDVMPPRHHPDLEKPAGRGRNEPDVAAYSGMLAAHVGKASADGAFVVLLGGDCSILLGSLLGLRAARGKPVGVVYVDAHADFATLDESPSGSACSMALALAVGRSDTPLAQLAGDGPLARPEHVAHVGARDVDGPYGHAALAGYGLLNLPGPIVQELGPAATALSAAERAGAALGGFWIHVDVDVLDPELMPAVDSPEPGGLTFDQLAELLAPLVAHPQALGLQLTIYDPTVDDGAAAAPLADLLERVVALPR
jgi:arginase